MYCTEKMLLREKNSNSPWENWMMIFLHFIIRNCSLVGNVQLANVQSAKVPIIPMMVRWNMPTAMKWTRRVTIDRWKILISCRKRVCGYTLSLKKNRSPRCCDVFIYLKNNSECLRTGSLFSIIFLGFHYSQFWI